MFLRSRALAWRLFLVCLVILAANSSRPAQANPAQTTRGGNEQSKTQAASRYSDAPYVFERYYTTERFENGGTRERDLSVRVRIQSEAGAQQFRDLVFDYIPSNEQLAVRSATIRKPDGSSVNVLAAPDSTKETTAAATRQFPGYRNFRETHLLAPSLRAGDVLEYDVATRVTKPFAPGQFWFQYHFIRDAIVLDERVELSLPRGRTFKIRVPEFSSAGAKESHAGTTKGEGDSGFTRTEEGGREILRWKHANLKISSGGEQSTPGSGAVPPDLQLTSFDNWDAVAHWYAEFQTGPSDPASQASQVATKTRELVRGATNDLAKAQSICSYVSEQVRSVNLSTEFGQLPPRTAAAVLASGYGDSEEKSVLLAAMLGAAGIRSDTALIAYGRGLDREFPSPSQFDHVLTVVREGEKVFWIDPSAELAPFGFLPAPLRGKPALLTGSSGDGRIVETPADPPFASTQDVKIDGRVSQLGILRGTVEYSLRGDTEFVLRTAFHRAPRTQWNELAQTILTLDGLRGDVTNVTTSDPLDTRKPFQLTIAFSDPEAFDWPMQRAKMALPLLTIAMPDPPSRSGEPVKLGTPLDVETHLRLTFPPQFAVHAPVGIAVARDYAEFKSSYRFENGELIADRALNFKARELPAASVPDYLAFSHAVQADEAQPLLIENAAGARAEIPANATADDVFEAGAAALKSGNTRGAIPLLQRATQLQPNHKLAWDDLGLAYMQAQRFADAAAAFQKQAEVNPSDEHAHDYLGLALEELHRDDEAAAAFQEQIELQPLDPAAHAQLGSILLAQRRYSDAVPELEKATVLSPSNAELEIRLGSAYLNIGDKDKALASFKKGAALSVNPEIRNEAALSLAEAGTELDAAEQYAELAIRVTAADLAKADLAHSTPIALAETGAIGRYWGTLGWVYFKKGNVAAAERYVRAAWRLNQSGEAGDHLAQIYEKSGEKERATRQCALALAVERPIPDTRARLMLLLGGNAQIDALVSKARPELAKTRTFRVKLPVKENASADFLIAMSPSRTKNTSAQIEAVRFVGGSDSLRRFANELKSLDYGEVFPDATPMKLIRRGTLACSAATGDCNFILSLPESASAAN